MGKKARKPNRTDLYEKTWNRVSQERNWSLLRLKTCIAFKIGPIRSFFLILPLSRPIRGESICLFLGFRASFPPSPRCPSGYNGNMLKVVAGVVVAVILQGAVVFGADVVISQVYTAGGNLNALFQNDFIELHNRGATPVSLTGWTLQYAISNTWSPTFLGGTLQPGQYYLIEEGSGGMTGNNLPPPNASSSVNLSTSSGKVALVSNGTTLTGSCPSGAPIVDFVGYGVVVNCSEGTAAPAPGPTTALVRVDNGCTDTENNFQDFTLAAPSPRNTFSAGNVCANPAPNFTFAQRALNGAFTANFTADAAKSNQVQFSFDLVGWTNLPIAISNAGAFFTFTDTNIASRRYYRVVAQ
jgi:hypothetical protein